MDKEARLALLALLIVYAAWRFVRYMRAGLSRSRRPMNLGVAGGLVPQDSDRSESVAAPAATVLSKNSLYARGVGFLVAIALLLGINALLWYCLLEVSPFKSLPPIPVGVVGVFANFYLIPLARKMGLRSRRRIDEARAGNVPSAP